MNPINSGQPLNQAQLAAVKWVGRTIKSCGAYSREYKLKWITCYLCSCPPQLVKEPADTLELFELYLDVSEMDTMPTNCVNWKKLAVVLENVLFHTI